MNKTRSRLVLVAIMLVFAAPLVVALLLNVSGWRPATTRNYGVLIEPPVDIGAAPVTLAGGGKLEWSDKQWHWTLLVLSNGDCGASCQARIADVLRMRLTLNRNAERLRVVHLGQPLPAASVQALAPLLAGSDDNNVFSAYRPKAAGSPALALVNPNGLLILRYDADFDVARVRQDLVKVVH
ncbi:MAG TPA: hypothetical protein VLB69_00610 [Rudaea sp.]|nr:hypothetical protein [Rudaea sp.]